MRTPLILAALAATLATSATARTTTVQHRHTVTRADSGSAAVRALNEKSLQQASAGATGMAAPAAAMSDQGSGASMTPPAAGSMSDPAATSPAMTPSDQTAPPAPTPQ